MPSEVEGFPMREWSIEIYVVGANDELLPATCFETVTYRLHESFGKRAIQGTNHSTPRMSKSLEQEMLTHEQRSSQEPAFQNLGARMG